MQASTPQPPNPRGGFLPLAAVAAAAAGALASIALQLYAGRRSPEPIVVLLIAGWVLSPFVVLLILNALARRWSRFPHSTLHWLMLLLSAASVAVYATAVVRPLTSKPPAFLFVVVPPVALLLATTGVAIAWLLAPRQR